MDWLAAEAERQGEAAYETPGFSARVRLWIDDRLAEERGRFALWLPVGIGAGAGGYFALTAEPPGWLGAVLLALCATAGLIGWRRPLAVGLALVFAAPAAGFAAAQIRTALVAAPMVVREVGPVAVIGRVASVERLSEGIRIVLDELTVDRLPAARTPRAVRIRLAARQTRPPAPGQRIKVLAVLHPPPAPAEPGAFDFQRHAFFLGLGAVGFALGPTEETGVRAEAGGWRAMSLTLETVREGIAERTAAAVGERAAAGVTTALMNGEQAGIPEPAMNAMRDSGLAHLISISGLHIGLVAGIVFFVVRAGLALIEPVALRWPIKKIAAFAGLLAAVAYSLLVGAPVPTVRSVLMTGLVLAAVIADRDPFSMRLVAFAGTAVVLALPDAMLGPSFQMSFAAVVALIAVYERASPVLARWRAGGGMMVAAALYLGGIALTSVVASAATTPYGMFHFQTVAFYGVVANMIAVPLTSFWVMPCSVLAYALMPFGLDQPALTVMGWGVAAILWTARTVAGWPGATALVPAMPLAGLAAMTLGGLWLAIWLGRWRWWGVPVALAGLFSPALADRPDLLVSETGALVAVREADGRLSLSTLRTEKRIAETWLRRDGMGQAAATWPRTGTAGAMSCDSLGCIYRTGGRLVAVTRDSLALTEDCAAVDVMITAGTAAGCRSPLVIDRRALARNGAYALSIDSGGIKVETVRDWRGTRPWTP